MTDFSLTRTVFNEETGQWERIEDSPTIKVEQEPAPVVTDPQVRVEPVEGKKNGRPRTGFNKKQYMRTYMQRYRNKVERACTVHV
jgi:hypothetical protein